jgi:hypothetical protein
MFVWPCNLSHLFTIFFRCSSPTGPCLVDVLGCGQLSSRGVTAKGRGWIARLFGNSEIALRWRRRRRQRCRRRRRRQRRCGHRGHARCWIFAQSQFDKRRLQLVFQMLHKIEVDRSKTASCFWGTKKPALSRTWKRLSYRGCQMAFTVNPWSNSNSTTHLGARQIKANQKRIMKLIFRYLATVLSFSLAAHRYCHPEAGSLLSPPPLPPSPRRDLR